MSYLNIILFIIAIIFSTTGLILKQLSNINSTDPKDKYNPVLGWLAIVSISIASIAVIIFLINTGIDLTHPTITQTRTQGVQQISSGIPLF
jgi:uncharacterized membrane-anchored protein